MAGTETIERIIREAMSYDPNTGSMTWLERHVSLFSDSERRTAKHKAANWNSKHAGKEAFTSIGNHGYRTGTLNQKRLLLHRVAYFKQTGKWPTHLIDHINGNKLDNRWCNIRNVNAAQNVYNRKSFGETCDYVGVSWNNALKGYMARVHYNGKSHYCGFSKDDPEKVARRRDAKAKELFGEYACLNFPEERKNG